jgi:hypothetical protein
VNLFQTLGKISNEYGSQRGSGYLLLAHPLLQVLRRWLTKCSARCVEVTGFTSYHPLVRSNSRIRIPELVTEFLDLLLDSLQTGAHLHKHILVMHHKHPENIGLDPISLELVLLPLRQ